MKVKDLPINVAPALLDFVVLDLADGSQTQKTSLTAVKALIGVGGTISGDFILDGIQSVTLPNGNTNDYALGANKNTLLITSNALGSTLTGIAGGVNGRIVQVSNVNNAAGVTNLVNNSASSIAANRILLPSALSMVLQNQESMVLWYDGTQSRWLVMSNAI